MNEPTQALASRAETTALDIDLDHVTAGLTKIKAFQSLVRKQLVPDHDFGTIPGTPKPSLWKPGAEKLCKLLALADSYQVIDKVEDWKEGFFYYRVTCELHSIRDGTLIAQGLGSCNSKESRYRYRWAFGSEVPEHVDKKSLHTKTIRTKKGQKAVMYRIENEDPYSLPNTLLKMAKKRAMVDGVLSAGRLSDIFSQGDGAAPDDNAEQSLKERRQQMLSYFQSKGVSQEQVFELIGVSKLQEVTLQHLTQLKQIAGNLKDGVATIEDFFGGEQPGQQESPAGSEGGIADAEVPDDDFPAEDEQPKESGKDKKLIEQKAELMSEVLGVLGQLHPGDDIQNDAERLKSLKHVFGKTVIDDIARLPLSILEAGLKVLKEQLEDENAD
jgi:hypothetical protein